MIYGSRGPLAPPHHKALQMPKIAYILLAHEHPDDLSELIAALIEGDSTCHVVIHYDAKSSLSNYEELRSRYESQEGISFVTDRVACGWGQFGLVEASVRALDLIRIKQIDVSHVLLLSGSCMPIRPLAELDAFLEAHPSRDFIESQSKDWITGGLKEERYLFWYPFGFRSSPLLFQLLTGIQKKIRVRRRFPRGLQPRFGSQWWCLTWATCEKILLWISKNPSSYRYFRSIWIPDECFFQTLSWHFSRKTIDNRTLTFYRFNKYGKPIVFFDENYNFLSKLPYFFARKISASAYELKRQLRALSHSPRGRTPPFNEEAKLNLSFDNILVESQLKSKPGQLFHPAHIASGWPGQLRHLTKSFAVLFGPPSLTQIAADILRKDSSLSVMGRLLKPGDVDFGPDVDRIGVLQRQDYKIRDMDPALYVSRIFNRTKGFPVFELSYLDAPTLVQTLFKMPNALMLPVLPLSNWRPYSSLFWLLSLPREKQHSIATYIETESYASCRQHKLNALLDDAFSLKAIEGVNRTLYKEEPSAALRFISPIGSNIVSDMGRRRMVFEHGPDSVALSDAVVRLNKILDSLPPEKIKCFLAPTWEKHFSPLIKENWAEEK